MICVEHARVAVLGTAVVLLRKDNKKKERANRQDQEDQNDTDTTTIEMTKLFRGSPADATGRVSSHHCRPHHRTSRSLAASSAVQRHMKLRTRSVPHDDNQADGLIETRRNPIALGPRIDLPATTTRHKASTATARTGMVKHTERF